MNAPEPLVLDLVEWIARTPRPLNDVMEGWRTSCPRLPVWEDAVDRGAARAQAGGRVHRECFGCRPGISEIAWQDL